ncbi:MAG: YbaN family protein [Myxococcota bacterium]
MREHENVGRPPSVATPLRWLFMALGFLFVGLGALGVVLPGLPTTPFMLLAAWMFSKSSPRFHAWLFHHRIFGPYVQQWERHRVIPLKAKLLSSSVMTITVILMFSSSRMPLVGAMATALACLGGALFIWRCPSRPPAEAPPGRA